jgi:hypothetical protein
MFIRTGVSEISRTAAKAIESNGYANCFVFNPEGDQTVDYGDWIQYSTEFLQAQP